MTATRAWPEPASTTSPRVADHRDERHHLVQPLPSAADLLRRHAALLFAFLLALGYLLAKLVGVGFPSGNPTIVIIVSLFSGIQLLSLGIMGEYVGRIYDEVKQRPKFILDSAHGIEAHAPHRGGCGGSPALRHRRRLAAPRQAPRKLHRPQQPLSAAARSQQRREVARERDIDERSVRADQRPALVRDAVVHRRVVALGGGAVDSVPGESLAGVAASTVSPQAVTSRREPLMWEVSVAPAARTSSTSSVRAALFISTGSDA